MAPAHEMLSKEEVRDFCQLGVPVEARYVPEDRLELAIDQRRVLEACSTSSMGTAETYWRRVEKGEKLEGVRLDSVVHASSNDALPTPYEDRLDERDVIRWLWEPFYRQQAEALARAIPVFQRDVVLSEFSRVLAALEIRWVQGAKLLPRVAYIAALQTITPATPWRLEAWLKGPPESVRHLVAGLRARWVAQNVAGLFAAVDASADRFIGWGMSGVLRLAMVRFGVQVAQARPWGKIDLAGKPLPQIPEKEWFLDQMLAVAKLYAGETGERQLHDMAVAHTDALLNATPGRMKPERTGIELLPVEQCPTCASLEALIDLNYEDKHVRPVALEALQVVGQERTEESSEAWRVQALLRCPRCGTFYTVDHSKDEGHSFMDPTHDAEQIVRISLHTALDFMGRYASIPLLERSALERRIPRTIDAMAKLVHQGGAPNWHVRIYGIECVIHAALVSGDPWAELRPLLEHHDPSVRVETLRELLDLATTAQPRVGYRALKRWLEVYARTFLAVYPPLPWLSALLSEPPAPTWEISTVNEVYRASDTHQAAAKCIGTAAHLPVAIEANVMAQLADLLLSEDPNRRFEAIWALLFAMGKVANDWQAAIIKERLVRVPEEIRTVQPMRMLVDRMPGER